MTQIKICGLMTATDVAAVNAAQPDLAGVVFAAGRHQVTLARATDLRQHLDPTIPLIGVFVDAPLSQMLTAVQTGAINGVQLHGHETENTILTLQAAGISVINVVATAEQAQTTQATTVMFDSGQGSGRPLDWTTVPHLERPFILAGGLTPENVTTAIDQVHPTVVDVSSGVETAGHKDPTKIATMVARAHARH